MGEEKLGFFARLKAGLSKTRENIVKGIDRVFSGFSSIDEDFYEELEEILIMGDIGVKATEEILENLRKRVKAEHIKEPADGDFPSLVGQEVRPQLSAAHQQQP